MNTYTVYDTIGRKAKSVGSYVAQATLPDEWVWRDVSGVFAWRLSAINDSPVSHGVNNDQNIISANTYNKAGIIVMTMDVQGKRNFMVYDALNRLVKTVQNAKPDATIEFSVGHSSYEATNDPRSDDYAPLNDPDKDIITMTTYNKAGQVVETADPHGTVTEFAYDWAGRRVSITQAEGTALETTSYTCFNKAGWVLRMIGNYIATSTLPDAKTGSAWDFNPSTHGTYNDENLITEYEFDQLGRQTKTINPLGEFTSTTYAKDGSVMTVTDQEGTITAYRYDKLRRRRMVVQGYIANDEDPANWVWDTTDARWEETDMTDVKVEHGGDNDENIIVQLTYDIAGRTIAMRNPRGFITEYAYDALNRRIGMTNPLANIWETGYEELGNGGRRTIQTFPNGYDVTREFDRMGRLVMIDYGDPSTTPTVEFGYDVLGNRQTMEEIGASGIVRKTQFGYDNARRMTSVQFDTDGNGIINEVVSYKYDERGLRTRLTFDNGAKSLTYGYDAKGRLVSMTDWDSHTTTYDYDDANRHRLTTRSNGVTSAYAHNTAGQLTDIHHKNSSNATLAQFTYALNGRGHRTQANETVDGVDTTIAYAYDKLARVLNANYYAGTTPTGTPAKAYAYGFDVAGNRLSESLSLNGASPTVTDYDYNGANQIIGTNYEYDDNGNMTKRPSQTGNLLYTWDRANRLFNHDGIDYTYDGLGNRVSQNNGTDITQYLLDIQPSLAVVLRQKIGSQNTHYVHGLREIASQQVGSVWNDAISDGFGSVRGWLDGSGAFVDTMDYDPYGMPDANVVGYGFTGEMTDANGLVYLRARYYNPNMGSFVSLDPFEGIVETPLSLNGYTYVEGNPINWVDPSGLCPELSDEVYNMADYLHCHDLVRRLKDWNIKVVWDENENFLSPLTCIPQTVRDTAEQSQDIKQRWTANEVRAIYNAFQIFNNAHQNLLLISKLPIFSEPRSYGYKWPRERAITIEKRRHVSIYSEDVNFMGKTDSENDIIILSAIRWGEANENMTMQPRSWLVLHEFSHIYIWDRAKFVRPDYYNVEAEWREKFGRFISSTSTRPTQYAGGPLKEYLTESITGVMWNLGYIAVQGYDSGAGGWTGTLQQSSPEGFVNVSNITGESNGEQISLAAFIFKEIIMPLTPSP